MSQWIEIEVPDIGDFEDVDVVEIFVAPGDHVQPNESLIALETDKASVEIPATVGGVVQELRIAVGDKVRQGSPILILRPDAAGATETPPQAETAPPPPPAASPAPPAPAPPALPASQGDSPVKGTVPVPAGSAAHASPSVRKLCRDLGVDVNQVAGTGPKGRILHEDVRQYVKAIVQGHGPAAGAGVEARSAWPFIPWPVVDFAKFGPVELQPLSRIRKLSGANLARNWVSIPHVTQFDETDITDTEAFRRAQTDDLAQRGIKLTLLAFLVKAVVAGLQRFPEFNSSLDGEQLVLKRYFHIGFAADTPHGLVVPVLRDADRKSLSELAAEAAELAAKAREGKLTAGDMQGGCFTISSLGGVGGTAFTPIIQAPEVAILGVSRAVMKPVWDGSNFVPRLMLPLSLSYDHRVIDGALAARFTSYLGQVLADVRRLLL